MVMVLHLLDNPFFSLSFPFFSLLLNRIIFLMNKKQKRIGKKEKEKYNISNFSPPPPKKINCEIFT